MKSGMHTFHSPPTKLIHLYYQKTLKHYTGDGRLRWQGTRNGDGFARLHNTRDGDGLLRSLNTAIAMGVDGLRCGSLKDISGPGEGHSGRDYSRIDDATDVHWHLADDHTHRISLNVHVPDNILLTKGLQSLSHTVLITAQASHRRRDNILGTAEVSAARITLPPGKLQS